MAWLIGRKRSLFQGGALTGLVALAGAGVIGFSGGFGFSDLSALPAGEHFKGVGDHESAAAKQWGGGDASPAASAGSGDGVSGVGASGGGGWGVGGRVFACVAGAS